MSVLYLYVLYLSRSLNTCRDQRATEPLLFKTLKYGPVFCSCSRVYAHVCDQSLILKATCWEEINLNQMLFAGSFYLLIILVNLDALHKETLKKLLKAYQQLTFKASFHQRLSQRRSCKRSRKSASDLVKIQNRRRKRSHKHYAISVRRIRMFPFFLTPLITPSPTFLLQ